MKKRLTIIAATVALLATGIAWAENSSGLPDTKTCPDGQELVGFNAGGLKAEQKPLPEGYSIEDTEDGKVVATSDRDSVTSSKALTIVCE